jgi:hypothetical protein
MAGAPLLVKEICQMYKKTIKYIDYNGVEREEDFYFHLNKAEIIEMESSVAGGYGEMLKQIIMSQDGPTIMKNFKTFILKSYGEKSLDGKHFMKSEEISKNFECTEAYSVLFMEICYNPDKAIEFINNILPFDNDQKQKFESEQKERIAKLTSVTENQGE